MGVVVEPTELYIQGPMDSQRGFRRSVPILSQDEEALGLVLEHGARVKVSLINEAGELYHPDLGQRLHSSLLVYVEKMNGEEAGFISGFVYASQLSGREPKKPFGTITPKGVRWPVMDEQAKARLSPIQWAIRSFHNGLCNDRDPTKLDQRKDLLDRWQRFIDGTPSGDRDLAKMAMQVDMVARTVLYEAHFPGQLSSRHGNQSLCEWDIITLSIRNRALTCEKVTAFRCGFPGDYVGVATVPNQYHIWRMNNVNNTYITSCFLRDDLQAGVYPGLSEEAARNYNERRKAFKIILERVPPILGLDKEMKQRVQGDYLREHFQVTHVGDREIQKTDETLRYLKGYHHYYHPGGLGVCFVDKYPYTQYIRAGDIEMHQRDGFINFSLLIDERIFKEGVDEEESWSFSIKNIGDDKVLRYLPSTNYFSGQPLISERNFKSLNTSYTCLPQGQLPRCYESQKTRKLAYGKRVPTNWFTEDVKSEVKDFLVRERGLEMPLGWEEEPVGSGVGIGLRCISKGLEEDQKFPEFQGMCDKDFMPVTGVH